MSAIEASGLTKVYRTYRKESGLWGSVKGLVRRKHDETRARVRSDLVARAARSIFSPQQMERERISRGH